MTRKYNLDLLRIISMLGIVGLHVIGAGGILNNIEHNSISYTMIYIIYILMYGSVNIFAMLTGYLCKDKTTIKPSNIIKLLFTIFLICITSTTIYYIFNPELFNTKDCIKYIFPFLNNDYWYISCYLIVFILIPYLNKIINNITIKEFKKLLTTLFILFSVITTIMQLYTQSYLDIFRVFAGYSPLWLIYCYLVGAYIRIDKEKTTYSKNIITIIISTSIILIFNFSIYNLTKININIPIDYYTYLLQYTSPFVLINSYCIFKIFNKLNIKQKILTKILPILSNAAIMVYLIHSNPIITKYIINNKYIFITNYNYNCIIKVLLILLVLISIYIVCFIIDVIKEYTFKLTRLNNLFQKFDKERN